LEASGWRGAGQVADKMHILASHQLDIRRFLQQS
jgi:hypothetical protein